jgi:tetratricopeptide (TPR) repeat protein
MELNRVQEALEDADRAAAIFLGHGEQERLFGLYNNIAMVYGYLGEQRRALEVYHRAQTIVDELGEQGQRHRSLLAVNMGFAYHMLGNFQQATHHYQQARGLFAERNEIRGIALVEHDLAHIAMSQGQHRRALELLLHARDLYDMEQLHLDTNNVRRDMVESYILLNRYAEARELAKQVIAGYQELNSSYREGLTLLHLAAAEANLGRLDHARAAIERATECFAAIGATTWIEIARLRSGQIALRVGETACARAIALAAMDAFAASGAQVEYGSAALLLGQTLLANGESQAALQHAMVALNTARQCNIPALRYSAHLLLGTIAEATGQQVRAARRYTAAMATIDRVQRGLTITLRPNFLDDKGEALHGLIRLNLRDGHAEHAFETLERAKSQILLGYLANREQLRWAGADERCRPLIEELNRLRDEHQWLYRLAHEQRGADDTHKSAITPEQALAELSTRERQMRAITERLYLYSGDDRATSINAPRMKAVQEALDDQTLLIEFYSDGASLWAFSLDARTLEVQRLPLSAAEAERLLAQLHANISFALNAGPGAPTIGRLTQVAWSMLQRLYNGLLAPLAGRIGGRRRLLIVPYGALHYLPFHMLRDETAYLIERHEVAIVPAAGLVLRQTPQRQVGVLALAHTWEDRLPQTVDEARFVQRLLGGTLHAEQAARRAALDTTPVQILHIAAHGEHRLDQPDLSYIQLADGQMYTDDLLQLDLSYELVTLSACESGRANVAANDELIGIGRGFLYAGAGALITSLWRVFDVATMTLMQRIYGSLRAGASKAAALRSAQLDVLVEAPHQHPAFWGAFQLIGDARPLSDGQA